MEFQFKPILILVVTRVLSLCSYSTVWKSNTSLGVGWGPGKLQFNHSIMYIITASSLLTWSYTQWGLESVLGNRIGYGWLNHLVLGVSGHGAKCDEAFVARLCSRNDDVISNECNSTKTFFTHSSWAISTNYLIYSFWRHPTQIQYYTVWARKKKYMNGVYMFVWFMK